MIDDNILMSGHVVYTVKLKQCREIAIDKT
jgi:hypothetical protein